MKHILIVEDDWVLYDEMARFFTENNYTVSNYAGSHESAMEEIKIQKPDIALLDIELEGPLNGINVAEDISKTMEIPFIFVSSHVEKAIIEKALKTLPNAYLFKSKTEDLNELLTNVEIALSNIKIKTSQLKETAKKILVYEDYYNILLKKYGGKNFPGIHLPLEKVLYIQTDKNNEYIQIITAIKTYLLRKKIMNLEPILPLNFIRVNRSQLVNLDKVTTHRSPELFINDLKIRISITNRERVKDRIASLYI
jgi:DNA-binding LytR/AlgR family response regulator